MAGERASFAAGVVAYAVANFNGDYAWHMVFFNEQYQSLRTWTRLDDVAILPGATAVALQAMLVAYMLPLFQRSTGGSGALNGAGFGLWVAAFVASVSIFAHSANNHVACLEGFAALEGLYCLLQYPLSCAFVAFTQERVRRRHRAAAAAAPLKAKAS